MTRSVLVVTVVHHPDDARIRHRQIAALLEAGWRVMYAAPFADYGLTRPVGVPGLHPLELPRASGRRRLHPLRAARRLLREHGPQHDVVLLHDPELLLALPGLRLPPVVWDVHEDTAAALEVRPWMPDSLRRPAGWGIRSLERWAERRLSLLLADHHYAQRFRTPHPVIPNTARVPSLTLAAATPDTSGRQRVVYLGSVTLERGAVEMIELGLRLQEATGGQVTLHVIGPAHGPAHEVVRTAHRDGALIWHGFIPSDRALPMLNGALAGLSLLHDEANFRPSMPTKVIEYLAHGIPTVTTPLPVPAELVERAGAGFVVPFGDVECTLEVLLRLYRDRGLARELGRAGYAVVREEFDWEVVAPRFVTALEEAARQGRPSPT